MLRRLLVGFKANTAELFDNDFYVEQNPDIRGSGYAPLKHYTKFGWKEGRDPSPYFSTSFYVSAYPAVLTSGMDPLTHYATVGKSLGFRPAPPVAEVTAALLMSENETVETAQPSVELEEEQAGIYFDRAYYLAQYIDIRQGGLDPFLHYMQHGWRELRNPSVYFDTEYYLNINEDIRSAGMNPLAHFVKNGRAEGRAALSFEGRLRIQPDILSVSVVIPNFNHDKFLPDRIRSVLNQTYSNFKIIILDDCSTDDSRSVIADFADRYPEIIEYHFNEHNSGSVFKQWRKGVELAQGDLVWICESDDLCEHDFLEHAVKAFRDDSVMLSFGRIQFCDSNGVSDTHLDHYRRQSGELNWHDGFVLPAAKLFNGPFANTNIIPNVGGCVFRRQKISDGEWSVASSFAILGDWYLYLILSRGGKVAYNPSAIAYFRQHGSNTSVKSFLKPHYYLEHAQIAHHVRAAWGSSDNEIVSLFNKTRTQYHYSITDTEFESFESLFDLASVLNVKRRNKHILIGMLGFYLGGGEVFPINLANSLVNLGFTVSIMRMRVSDEDSAIRKILDSRVGVYDMQYIQEYGVDKFVDDAGIDLIHSHFVGIDLSILGSCTRKLPVPYIVTLHGSYETTAVSDDKLLRIIRGVDSWIYLTKRNLSHLDGIPLNSSAVRSIPNGMPVRSSRGTFVREDYGISEDDIVFATASRAIDGKGWLESVRALQIAQASCKRKLHLLLCGTGPVYDQMLREGTPDGVHLLGLRNDVTSVYEEAECVVLATRFNGESYPLTLIEALQSSKPIISSSVGEIDNIVGLGEGAAGIVISPIEDDGIFTKQLAQAMVAMTNQFLRDNYADNAVARAAQYDMRKCVERYVNVYGDFGVGCPEFSEPAP